MLCPACKKKIEEILPKEKPVKGLGLRNWKEGYNQAIAEIKERLK